MYMLSTLDFSILEIGQPCAEEEILEVEQILDFSLPQELRNFYRAVNGFVGPSNVRFLYPLSRKERFSRTTMLGLTQILRSLPDAEPLWRNAVAFGDYGIGSIWGMTSDAHIFEWWQQDAADPFFLDLSLRELWNDRGRLFSSIPAF